MDFYNRPNSFIFSNNFYNIHQLCKTEKWTMCCKESKSGLVLLEEKGKYS
jgi:hypothetical protein